MSVWVILGGIGLIVGLWIGYWMHTRYPMDVAITLVPPPPPGEAPLISVIIPARNEARNIRACLESLFSQSYPNFEIIVVDDRSRDSTPQILAELMMKDPRLKVVQGEPLPEGWAGKPHALWQGVRQARGEWLCFLDADTFAAPELLASTYAKAQALCADLLSILTFQEMCTFWEKVILPLIFTGISVGYPPQRVNDPALPDAIANGQFLLFRRSAYQSIGGHAAVKDSIVEDRDLAVLVKGSGMRLVLADGRKVATTRMYTRFSEIWEGWTKNIYLGIHDDPRLLGWGVLGVLLTLVAAVGLPAWLISAGNWVASGGGLPAVIVLIEGVIETAWVLLLRALTDRGMGISPVYALTTPLGTGILAAMMFTSAFNVISGRGVKWKGRVYRQ